MKDLCLGSALWGWGIDKKNCFLLLDRFYDLGNRYVDSAFNYPINNDPHSLHLSRDILSEWIQTNGIKDLKVIYKIGSVSNQKIKTVNLNNSFLINQIEECVVKIGPENLECAMIHWDNEVKPYDEDHFRELFDFLLKNHFKFGLSGISPGAYRNIDFQGQEIIIEGKINLLQNDIEKYNTHFNLKKMFAYGISVSGLKLKESDYRNDSYVKIAREQSYHSDLMTLENKNKINKFFSENSFCKTMYHAGITLCENTSYVNGYIVGPRDLQQLEDIIAFRKLYSNLKGANKALD